MALTTTPVTITLNKHLFQRYQELREECYKLLGERFEISSYFNDGLKQLVETMSLYVNLYKTGKLNSDVIISRFHQLMSEESVKVIREAKVLDKKLKKK